MARIAILADKYAGCPYNHLVNYYDLLQINPRAEIETIERVYRIMAARYHPDNRQTGDAERFRVLTDAYQMLRDPVKRKEYDRQFEVNQAGPLPIFLGKEFTDGIDAEAKIRIGVLCLLYSKRRANPDYAALSLLDMENIMAFPRERLLFALVVPARQALRSPGRSQQLHHRCRGRRFSGKPASHQPDSL